MNELVSQQLVTDALLRITTAVICMLGYSFLLFRQSRRSFKRYDNISPVRFAVLGVFLLAIVTFIPSIFNQYLILIGHESAFWKSLSLRLTNINQLASLALIFFIEFYRIKDK